MHGYKHTIYVDKKKNPWHLLYRKKKKDYVIEIILSLFSENFSLIFYGQVSKHIVTCSLTCHDIIYCTIPLKV